MTKAKDKAVTEPAEAELVDEHGVVVRPALEVLARLRGGNLLDAFSLELNRVVNAVKDNAAGKGGSITLTLKIDRLQKHPNAVQIVAKVGSKAPEDPPATDLMFYDNDGNLFTRNPNQRDFFETGPQGI